MLPPNLDHIVQLAIKTVRPTKIWLFGSRARGDALEKSDFDLAFEFPKRNEKNWVRFCLEIEDNPPTLHRYDLVDLCRVDKKLKAAVLKEGIILYEKRAK